MMKFMLFNILLMINLKFKKFKFFSHNFIIILMFMNMMMFNFNKKFNYIYYFYSMDYITFYLIMLTNWILMLSILSNWFMKTHLNNYFLFLMLILNFFLMMFFLSMNLYMFYIYFEITLIPILYLIMGWGNQINRIQATMYMLFYTLFGSFPLFFFINYLYINLNSASILMIFLTNYNLNINLLIYLFMMLAFIIKMPMYFMHLWLPKAHVEAPISGSMILAGIMLKLGSYGILRLIFIFPFMLKFNNYLLILSIMGSFLASLVSLNQIDLKIIVAYSSIVHMSMMFSSMMTMNMWMFKSSMMLMIAHGLCASNMFFNVNLIYERTNSRNLLINKGMINISPTLTLMWFLTYSNNFSSPPSLNLISEIFLINSLMIWSNFMSMMLIFIMFINTCFSIYIYSKTQHGNISINLNYFKFINIREIYINFMHWVPLNLMFLMINLI